MVIQHNLQAMNSNRLLGITQGTLSNSTEKLSSGYKINRAADNAAGLAISEKMRKQIRGLTQASANAEDGISSVQTAEGALQEVHDMLQRMNELAVQSANGTNSTTDRQYIQDEIDQLVTEIDRVAETSKFNETYLLKGKPDGSGKTVYTESYTVTYTKNLGSNQKTVKSKFNYNDTKALIITSSTIKSVSNEGKAVSNSISKGEDVTKYLASGVNGAKEAGIDTTKYTAFTTATTSINNQQLTIDADNGNITRNGDTYIWDKENNQVIKIAKGKDLSKYLQNVEVDKANSGKTKYQEMKDGYVLLDEMTGDKVNKLKVETDISEYQLYDAEGNKVSGVKLREYFNEFGIYKGGLYDDNQGNKAIAVNSTTISKYVNKSSSMVADDLTFSLHVGADSTATNKITTRIQSMSATSLGINVLKSSEAGMVDDSGAKATDAIDVIAEALQKVSTQRSALGAVQNRLEHTIKNLDNIVENTTSAESAIRDTDMADEMVRYSNNNILSQAGQSMLAQANQSNQGVLSLLG